MRKSAMCPNCAPRRLVCPPAGGFVGCRLGEIQANRAGHACSVVRAVAARHLVEVLLVVVLGEVEVAGGDDLRCDLPVAGLGQLLLVGVPRLQGRLLLFRRLVEDRRAVLGADVVALAHALGGVVRLPEDLEQVSVGYPGRVEDDPDGLGVTGAAGADFLVGRVGGEATLVADGGGDDARGLPELSLRAPEAAHRELCDLCAFRVGRSERPAEHLVTRRDRHRGLAAGQRLTGRDRARLVRTEQAHCFLLLCGHRRDRQYPEQRGPPGGSRPQRVRLVPGACSQYPTGKSLRFRRASTSPHSPRRANSATTIATSPRMIRYHAL